MKALLLSLFALGVTATFGVAAGQGDHVATITTLRGATFRQCTIVRIYPDGVSFTHSKGAAKIQFTDLEPEWREELGYDSKKAAEYQKDLAQRRRIEGERRAQVQQDLARARVLAQEAQLKRLQVLERQYIEASARREAAAAQGQGQLLPAVGFPGIYYGPLNQITGPAYGGNQWRGREPRYSTYATVGCGSGGILSYGNSRHPSGYSGTVRYSPTLGTYQAGTFINFGGFLPIAYGGRQMGSGFGGVPVNGCATASYGAPHAAPACRTGGIPLSAVTR